MLSQVLNPLAAAYLPGLNMEALAYVALGGLYGAALYIAARRSRPPPAPTPTRSWTSSSPDSEPARARPPPDRNDTRNPRPRFREQKTRRRPRRRRQLMSNSLRSGSFIPIA